MNRYKCATMETMLSLNIKLSTETIFILAVSAEIYNLEFSRRERLMTGPCVLAWK